MQLSGMRELQALLLLAWTRCSSHIADVVGLFLGSVIGMFMLTVVIAYNYLTYIPYPGINTLSQIVFQSTMTSLFFGTLQASIGMLFIAILICLFEYTYSFCRVAYYYDDCSWTIVNAPAALFGFIERETIAFFKGERDRQNTINKQKQIELREKIMLVRVEAEENRLKEAADKVVKP
jgi:hypothetical protein